MDMLNNQRVDQSHLISSSPPRNHMAQWEIYTWRLGTTRMCEKYIVGLGLLSFPLYKIVPFYSQPFFDPKFQTQPHPIISYIILVPNNIPRKSPLMLLDSPEIQLCSLCRSRVGWVLPIDKPPCSHPPPGLERCSWPARPVVATSITSMNKRFFWENVD